MEEVWVRCHFWFLSGRKCQKGGRRGKFPVSVLSLILFPCLCPACSALSVSGPCPGCVLSLSCLTRVRLTETLTSDRLCECLLCAAQPSQSWRVCLGTAHKLNDVAGVARGEPSVNRSLSSTREKSSLDAVIAHGLWMLCDATSLEALIFVYKRVPVNELHCRAEIKSEDFVGRRHRIHGTNKWIHADISLCFGFFWCQSQRAPFFFLFCITVRCFSWCKRNHLNNMNNTCVIDFSVAYEVHWSSTKKGLLCGIYVVCLVHFRSMQTSHVEIEQRLRQRLKYLHIRLTVSIYNFIYILTFVVSLHFHLGQSPCTCRSVSFSLFRSLQFGVPLRFCTWFVFDDDYVLYHVLVLGGEIFTCDRSMSPPSLLSFVCSILPLVMSGHVQLEKVKKTREWCRSAKSCFWVYIHTNPINGIYKCFPDVQICL